MECDHRIYVCAVLILIFGGNVATSLSSDFGNCSGLKLLSDVYQPKYSKQSSFIRKCCPLGQSYEVVSDKGKGNETRRCTANNLNFSVSVVNAVFYENCIEDSEKVQPLSYNYVNACTLDEDTTVHMLLYARAYGDLLYVLQNGSLLIVEESFEAYEIQSDYCLDEGLEGLYAIVCIHSKQQARVMRGEAVIYAVCLWLSVASLLFTTFFYLKIGALRELHGKSLSAYFSCLAMAYALLAIVQIQLSIRVMLAYCFQYCMLASTCWLSALCCDICIKIWYIFVRRLSCSISTEDMYFPAYAIASFGLPILPVIYAISQHKSGIPFYYIEGQHADKIFTGGYFLISGLLFLFCCGCLTVTFYAFRKRRPKIPNEHSSSEAVIEYEEFFKLKGTTKNVAILLAVISICRIIELITSHLSEAAGGSAFEIFDIFIALQGVFILIIFVCSTTPLRIIKRWYTSKGSLDVVVVSNSELCVLTN